MISVLFVLPKDDGLETPSGDVFNFSCSEDAPIGDLFGVIRKRATPQH